MICIRSSINFAVVSPSSEPAAEEYESLSLTFESLPSLFGPIFHSVLSISEGKLSSNL